MLRRRPGEVVHSWQEPSDAVVPQNAEPGAQHEGQVQLSVPVQVRHGDATRAVDPIGHRVVYCWRKRSSAEAKRHPHPAETGPPQILNRARHGEVYASVAIQVPRRNGITLGNLDRRREGPIASVHRHEDAPRRRGPLRVVGCEHPHEVVFAVAVEIDGNDALESPFI